MVTKKLQVFISSTYTDMKDERQAAVEAVLKMGHIPAGMELFAAGDASQADTIRQWIADSDVFMLILAGRYGSIEPMSGKSYVEMEYDYALSIGKPHFAICIEDSFLDQKVKTHGTDVIETANSHLLGAFRTKVLTHMCAFYSSIADIRPAIYESLVKYGRDDSLFGWIRGSEVADQKSVLEAIAGSHAEAAELRRQVAERDLTIAQLRSSTAPAATLASIATSLSSEAKKLIKYASFGNGTIRSSRTALGYSVTANNVNLVENPASHREGARWTSAVEELVVHAMVTAMGNDGRCFEMTKRGYDLVDELGQQERGEQATGALPQ